MPGRILIVDDDPLVLRALKRTFADHHVHLVSSVQDALELVAAGEHFDVILSDVVMPEATGIDFHRELRARSPELATRIVFLTGGALTERAETTLMSLGNLRISKPFDPKALRSLIDRILEHSAVGDRAAQESPAHAAI